MKWAYKVFVHLLLWLIPGIILAIPSIGILYSPTTESYYTKPTYDNIIRGVLSVLDYGKLEYEVINTSKVTSIPDNIKVLIDPSNGAISDSEINLVESYLMKGGKLIACYESGLKDAQAKNRSNFAYSKFLGVKFVSWDSGKYFVMKPTQTGVSVFKTDKNIPLSRGFTFVIDLTQNATPLAIWYTKDGKISNEKYPAAAVLSPFGVYFGENIFLQTSTNDELKSLVLNTIGYLLEEPISNVNPVFYLKASLDEKIATFETRLLESRKKIPKTQLYKMQEMLWEIKDASKKASDLSELKKLQKMVDLLEIQLLPQYNVQLRGIWFDSYAIRDCETPEKLRKQIRELHELGFNAIFPEVIYKGMTISPKISRFPQDPAFQDWKEDPLQVIVDEAKKLGMEVHAWCWIYAVASGGIKTPFMDAHPEWIEKDKYGSIFSKNNTAWLSHANPEVRDYLINTLLEVIQKYDVDGINLDYIRYDGDEFGYDEFAVKRFKEETGIDPFTIEKYSKESVIWQMWREENVNTFVREFYSKAKKIKNNLVISAAVYPTLSGARMEKKQNWEYWVKSGYLDLLIPMDYRNSAEDLKILFDMQSEYKKDVYLCPGLQLISLDEPKKVIDQIALTNNYFKSGFVLFSVSHIKKFSNDYEYFRVVMSKHAVTPFKGIDVLLDSFADTLMDDISIFTENDSLKEDINFIFSEFEKIKKSSNYADLVEKISNGIFTISDNVKDPTLALSAIDSLSWMLEIAYPAANKLKPKSSFIPQKPKEMVVVENIVPIPKLEVKQGKATLSRNLEEWKDAETSGQFLMYDTGQRADVSSYAKVMYDDENLYVLFVCKEPDFSSVKVVSGPRDTRTYLGDSVEVFILKDERTNSYYHFVVGFDGTIYDELGYDSKWNGDIVATTWREIDAWYVEIKINMNYLGMSLKDTSELKANFCRNRWKGNIPFYYTWSVTYGSFHTPERFGKLIFQRK
ncbi:family 10 glycosylhydrolase [Fervidobacterium islandicum]|uniref:Family 10 glycosylhydrolase n=1 Tax=Fervidobacterium islandicum TaxID=2423 RepID=A0AAI8CLT0_FERIS|nr:family 10 glycosylhydrolase [Fervidobacterium islandicum]AMW32706.1 family 10 glycosylhydrolase [Fervidobacterium islandicum]